MSIYANEDKVSTFNSFSEIKTYHSLESCMNITNKEEVDSKELFWLEKELALRNVLYEKATINHDGKTEEAYFLTAKYTNGINVTYVLDKSVEEIDPIYQNVPVKDIVFAKDTGDCFKLSDLLPKDKKVEMFMGLTNRTYVANKNYIHLPLIGERYEGLSIEDELEQMARKELELAAWFHEIGHTRQPFGMEKTDAERGASDFALGSLTALRNEGFDMTPVSSDEQIVGMLEMALLSYDITSQGNEGVFSTSMHLFMGRYGKQIPEFCRPFLSKVAAYYYLAKIAHETNNLEFKKYFNTSMRNKLHI